VQPREADQTELRRLSVKKGDFGVGNNVLAGGLAPPEKQLT
jgi:hypothetical protein